MTIETSASSVTYTGNGATTSFDYSFLIPESEDVIVSLTTIADNTSEEIDPSLYNITGLDDPNGGSVTYPLSGSPISSAYRLTIQRVLPLTQETDLTNQDGFYPDVVESAFDTLCMQIQQVQEEIDRSVIFPVGTESDVPALIAAILAGAANAAAAAASAAAAAASAASVANQFPIGAEIQWPGTSAPTGWLLEYGQVVSQATYADLFAVLGTNYNTGGEGAGNFRLPDMRGVVPAGKADMGGSDKGNLPGGTVLGASLGAATKILLTANLPAYTPAGTNSTSAVTTTSAAVPIFPTGTGGGATRFFSDTATGVSNTIAATGTAAAQTFTGTAQGGTATAFSIVQPTTVRNWIIFAGV